MRQIKIGRSITNRDSPALQKYLQDISAIKLINPDEEVLLAQKIKLGDRTALNKLVNANLRFVVSVAKQYQDQGLTLSDLVNSGNLGLIKAAEKYDETRGFKFISYAVSWIRQSILQALAEDGKMVRLPGNKVELVRKIHKFSNQYITEYGIAPSEEVLADALDVSVDKIRDSISASHQHSSLDVVINPEDASGETFGSTLPSDSKTDDDVNFESLKMEIEKSLNKLSPNEADAVRGSFGMDGVSVHSVEKKYNLTLEKIKQLKERALKKLRLPENSKLLRIYLGN